MGVGKVVTIFRDGSLGIVFFLVHCCSSSIKSYTGLVSSDDVKSFLLNNCFLFSRFYLKLPSLASRNFEFKLG